jgi:hypothetical protein
MTQVLDHRQIVGDEKVGQPTRALQRGEQVHHLRLHRDIKGADHFVTDEQPGFDREGTGNPQSLTLSATELMRVPRCHGRIESNVTEQSGHALAPCGSQLGFLPEEQRFPDDLACGPAGIERTVGILKDHLEPLARSAELRAGKLREIASFKTDAPGRGRFQADNGAPESALAASAFADQPDRLTRAHGKADSVNGPNNGTATSEPVRPDWEMHLQILDFEKVHAERRIPIHR